MDSGALLHRVPHSAGTAAPARPLPAGACDSHMHIFDPRFAPSPHWKRTPPVADVAAYRQLQARIGTTRTVVVTPSTYGVDNRCTLAALDELGDQARGVAVVDVDVTAAELQRLHRHRVRGLRVNFYSPQSWGETTPQMLSTLAAKVAPLGWHMQVLARPATLLALAPVLQALPVPLVIDHMALIGPEEGTRSEAFALVQCLLQEGRTWMKLSGAYMASRTGAPDYADRDTVARALLAGAPGRMLWGSDWPHTTAEPGSVDDAALVDRLQGWCDGDEALRHTVLVDNPAALYGFD
ncbi:amidohydrolase family protein [Xylophilus sp. GOD-11R]|uniref:amidohydrolase family protein n=1 Tax=Xylophilus sp. GOD-11R TaxID=3089814 RepID=UPI00298D1684|nr:amidohydrolase family protein [Xylophilus sp. GOD-11R]WPB58438.1 amidohydrolase family protein [Xylophilus sp. GOD-11R]